MAVEEFGGDPYTEAVMRRLLRQRAKKNPTKKDEKRSKSLEEALRRRLNKKSGITPWDKNHNFLGDRDAFKKGKKDELGKHDGVYRGKPMGKTKWTVNT